MVLHQDSVSEFELEFHNHDGFMRDLSRLLNEHSIDSLCDTPDFVSQSRYWGWMMR